MLGVRHRHFPWTEAAYRKNSRGKHRYGDRMEAPLSADDGPLLDRITEVLRAELHPEDLLIVPLAGGNHVDHVVTRYAAERLGHGPLMYYPDLPYVSIDPATLEQKAAGLRRFDYRLGDADISRWVGAVRCYTTQLRMLEDAAGPVEPLIARFAAQGAAFIYGPASVAPEFFSTVACTRADQEVDAAKKIVRQVEPFRLTPQHNSVVMREKATAPIAVFAFRRLGLLRQTLSSLERCDGFDGRRVTIFSDASRDGRPEEAAEVDHLRWWVAGWCSRHGARQQNASTNLGLRRSITGGITSVLGESESAIILEDDLILSPSFLTFMDGALHAYNDREDIVQVSGYFVPHNASLPPLGLIRAPSSWGWATWRRAWRHYNDDAEQLLTEVRARDADAFDMDGTYGYFDALERNATGTLDTWAVRWYASVFLRGGLTVYPRRSFVRNIGFGDDGTNCGPGPMTRVFDKQRIAGRVKMPSWKLAGAAESPAFAEAMREFYRWQQYQWTKPSFSERVRSSLGRVVGSPTRG